MQIHVARKLWKYQLVQFKEKTYCLTGLGFEPNVAPKAMETILKTVLKKMDSTKNIGKFGLITKSPESLEGETALDIK